MKGVTAAMKSKKCLGNQRAVRGTTFVCALLISLLGISACDKRFSTVEPSAVVASEENPLGEFARAFAMALEADDLRARIKNDMGASLFKEQKLPLLAYLESSSGSLLLGRVAARLGKGPAELLSSVRGLGSLEFYLPVRAQRESWRGGRDLLLALQLKQGDKIYAYDLGGRAVTLTEDQLPTAPTLVIVGAETNFSTAPATFANRTTMAAPSAAGLYMSYVYLSDLHEPWTRGEPEIEVAAIIPNSDGSASYIYQPSCAHQGNTGRKFYDMDHNEWFGDLDGDDQDDVLVVDSMQLIDIKNRYPASIPDSSRSILVQWWEDDTERCVLYKDAQNDEGKAMAAFVFGAVSVGLGFNCILTKCEPAAWVVLAIVADLSFLEINRFFSNNDDFIGTAAAAPEWNARTGDNVVRTHAIVRDSTRSSRTGVANLHWRASGYYGF